METKPIISVVIGSYNRSKLLKLTIESVRDELKSIPHEMIIVDGGSTDGALKWLMKQKDIITIIQHNRGRWKGEKLDRKPWGYFMNLGFKCAHGKYICMLSDDCLIVPGSIINGYNLFEEKINAGQKVGALAFYWRHWPEKGKYWVGLTLGNKMFVNHGMYLKKALEDIGFIDEETYHFYYADGDLCLKIWEKGYRIVDSPDSYVEHYSHADPFLRRSNAEREREDWKSYLDKWTGSFYNGSSESGGQIAKEFTDPNHTADKYRLYHILNIKCILYELGSRVLRNIKIVF